MLRFSLRRLGGLAAMVGGALWIAKLYIDRDKLYRHRPPEADALLLVMALFLVAGLTGLYAHRAGHWGVMGKACFVLGLLPLAQMIAVVIARVISARLPGPLQNPDLGMLLLFPGTMCVGLAMVRIKALPKWNAVPVLMGFLLPLDEFVKLASGVEQAGFAVAMGFGVGWALLGYALWSRPIDTPAK